MCLLAWQLCKAMIASQCSTQWRPDDPRLRQLKQGTHSLILLPCALHRFSALVCFAQCGCLPNPADAGLERETGGSLGLVFRSNIHGCSREKPRPPLHCDSVIFRSAAGLALARPRRAALRLLVLLRASRAAWAGSQIGIASASTVRQHSRRTPATLAPFTHARTVAQASQHSRDAYGARGSAGMSGRLHQTSKEVVEVQVIEDSESEGEEQGRGDIRQDLQPKSYLTHHTFGVVQPADAPSGPARTAGNGESASLESASNSDSDIEVLPQPSLGASRPASGPASTTTRQISTCRTTRRRNKAGGFTSASALLKEEVRRTKRASSTNSERTRSRSPKIPVGTPYIPAVSVDRTECASSTRSPIKLDEDDDPFALPPPLPSPLPSDDRGSDSPTKSVHIDVKAASESEEESCETLLRRNITRFQANGKGSAKIERSLSATSATSNLFHRSNVDSSSRTSSAKTTNKGSSAITEAESEQTSGEATSSLTVPGPYLALITACPVCSASWTVSKANTSKHAHIRKCASQRSFMPRTVIELVERQIKEMQDAVEQRRKEAEQERTLFERTVSGKGKDVHVVGVEKKQRRLEGSSRREGGSGSDVENLPVLRNDSGAPNLLAAADAVLYTQNGSAHSQATHTQVQREINQNIKLAQKISKGSYVSGILQPRRQSLIMLSKDDSSAKSNPKQATARSAATGSKNWTKAAELLARSAAKNDLKGQPADEKPGKLESYSSSRFRLAEKARRIASERSILPIMATSAAISLTAGSATVVNSSFGRAGESRDEGTDGSDSCSGLPRLGRASFPRPYRRTDQLSPSLMDTATGIAESLPYDLWTLAGSAIDSNSNRVVVSHYSLCL